MLCILPQSPFPSWLPYNIEQSSLYYTRGPCWFVVVQSLSRVQLFVTSWTASHQASLSFTISRSLLKLMSIESVMPSNHLILCHPLLLASIFPSIRVFPNESIIHIWWPKYWSVSISPSNEYSVLISFRIDWFDLLAVQGSLRKESSPCWLSILNIAVYTCESQTPFTSIFRLSFP